MIKILINNPVGDHLWGITPLRFIKQKLSVPKYGYLLKELANRPKEVSLGIFISVHNKSWLYLILKYLSTYMWCIINHIPLNNIRIMTNKNKICEYDIFFSLSRACLKTNEFSFLKKAPIIKVLHLSHFMVNTSILAKHARIIGIDLFISESNLKKNSPYFQKHFPFYNKDVYILPFVPQQRFTSKTTFKKRTNKCLALGSLSVINSDSQSLTDFMTFFDCHTYHPMRKEIRENKESLLTYLDCLSERHLKPHSKTYSHYYKIDIVNAYNTYKMFIYPEEIHGLPALGFVEGMACGCAYIGLDHPMYTDIGMKNNEHYIAYNGTLDHLKERIAYYQKHPNQLEQIAQNGQQHILSRHNKAIVTNLLIGQLHQLK